MLGTEKVEVKVICVERGNVKLGINAGKKVRIFRKELVDGSKEVCHGLVEM
jgi:carbon storage regulator CsrA